MYDAIRSLSSHMTLQNDSNQNDPRASPKNTQKDIFPLLNLPSEILHHILSFLPPTSLSHTSSTCTTLSKHCSSDLLWSPFLSHITPTPAPYQSWKSLYAAHHPYWFLPARKLFFSDKATVGSPLLGQLILARYNPRTAAIEAYRLLADQPASDAITHWPHNPDVLVSEFNPSVGLFLDDPVVRLEPGFYQPGNRVKQEILLSRGPPAIRSRIFPAIRIPRERQYGGMALWPPATIPVGERVRNDSATLFKGADSKPGDAEGDMSTTAFRIRKWLVFGGMSERLGVKMAEDVMTWASLPESVYVATARKPYQGIWVGDYNGHGCEFLVVIQRTPEEAAGMGRVRTIPDRRLLERAGGAHMGAVVSTETWLQEMREEAQGGGGQAWVLGEGEDGIGGTAGIVSFVPPGESLLPEMGDLLEDWERENPGEVGRLDAIKLTGDANIPRGEPSWIAEDIGWGGLLRVADEKMFRGARVVKSAGHIAGRGFASDRYTPTQLILVSHDVLAQYWEEMGHISYFKRVNVDEHLKIR